MSINEKERLLCYSAGILGSMLSARNENESTVHNWMVNRSIRAANKLINTIFDEEKLKEILQHEHVET